MALFFKSTAFLPLLLVILLPSGGDSHSRIFNFGLFSIEIEFQSSLEDQPALIKSNHQSEIIIPDSFGTVRDNRNASVRVAKAHLDVQNNEYCYLYFHGGSLKLSDSKATFVSGSDHDLDITECQDFRISGQQNKGTFWDSQDITIVGKDNDFDVLGCKIFSISGQQNKGTFWDSQHVTFVGNRNNFDVVGCQHFAFFGEGNKGTCKNSHYWTLNGNDNKLRVDNCSLIDVTSSSNKMTIFAKDSQHVSVHDSSNSQVKMSRVETVIISGTDVTLEGTDIKYHTFLGKSCGGNNITHKLVLPSKFGPHFFAGHTITINGITATPSSSAYGEVYWPTFLQFCNAAIVSGPTFKIGGLPSLTIKVEENRKTAVIKMTEGNAECKIVSEDGEMKVSISALSEELLIEGAKEIRRVEDGKCEFVLTLGRGGGVSSEDMINYNMLKPLFDVGKGALDLAHSFLHNFI